ncbi:MAG: TolC family protein, partial [Chitinophagaceae bacterium]
LHISLQQAIKMGIDSSKQLKISKAKIQEAVARYEQMKDKQLPTIKASYMASEAFIPTQKIQIKGMMQKPFYLPSTSMINLGTFSVNEAIFAGNKLRYAEQSANLLEEIAKLNSTNDKQDVTFMIIQSYINLYEIDENLKIIAQNLQDVQGRLDETIKFKDQGLATENDVLRFQLQKSQVELTQLDLENNRTVANYAMDVLMGLPDSTLLEVDSVGHTAGNIPPMEQFIGEALQHREDLATFKYQDQLSDINIKNIKADKLPTLGAGFSTYYLNPTKQFFPAANSFLVPMTLGLNLSWNISNLYTTKHKLNEAEVQQQEVQVEESITSDKIRVDVSKNYHDYLESIEKIKVLQTAVEQASENDRIMELKYRNQLATTT